MNDRFIETSRCIYVEIHYIKDRGHLEEIKRTIEWNSVRKLSGITMSNMSIYLRKVFDLCMQPSTMQRL